MTASTCVRPLHLNDVAVLQQLDRDVHGECWSRRAFLDQIDTVHFRHLVAVEGDDRVVGHAASWLDGTILRITNVATAADRSGRGIATRLLVDLLRDRCTARSVRLEVRPTNRRAQLLYRRFGFAPVGVDRDFYPLADGTGGRDALIMSVDDANDPRWLDRVCRMENAVGGSSSTGTFP